MQKILSINEIKVYSRKQVIAWVSSYGFNFEQLKNGLFFIKILRKLVSNDINRCKICQKPLNQYEQTQNMNIVKKVLNKHNLQLNMNVQSIIVSKNCFQLANWFKNLYQQNKSDKDTQFHYSQKSFTPSKFSGIDEIPMSIANYKSLSRATSSGKNTNSGGKKIARVTSGFIGIDKKESFNYTIKLPKESMDSQLNYQMLSISLQNEQKDIKNRTLKPSQIRVARSKSKNTKKNNWFNSPSNCKNPVHVPTQQQNLINLMKIDALEQQIKVYQQILDSVSHYVKNNELLNLDKMRKQIIEIIYKIKLKSISQKEL